MEAPELQFLTLRSGSETCVRGSTVCGDRHFAYETSPLPTFPAGVGSRTRSNAVSPGIWLPAVHSVHCYPSGFHKDLAAREPHPLGARSRERKSRVMQGRHPGLSQGGTAKSGSRARSWSTEGLPNQTGSTFPERVGGQEAQGREPGGGGSAEARTGARLENTPGADPTTPSPQAVCSLTGA